MKYFFVFDVQNDENGAPKDENGKIRQPSNGKKLASSPNDEQQKILTNNNNNNNNIDANPSNHRVEASSPGSEKSRLFSKMLPPEDDRILKEMVCSHTFNQRQLNLTISDYLFKLFNFVCF